VTSKDGFQLEVNVRMVIRIQPGNAAYIIARFGSVANLIDQIVHPLIDSSFRNKAGEKKAIDFFQSRTDLQTEALAHAKDRFSEYNVEAQNLLIAYIDIPKDLLDTQTKKEIANQQQAQYDQEAMARKNALRSWRNRPGRINRKMLLMPNYLSILIMTGLRPKLRKLTGTGAL
jgi:regulator of protease activity HflC (stomatin/prohibitin superfamily)